MKNILLKSIFLLSFLFTAITGFAQGKIPPRPSLETSYYEIGTTLLDGGQKKAIEQKLIQYADSTSTQIVVVVIPTTDGDDIDRYKVDMAHAWGIGQKGKDNGILLLVAKDDHKVAIATGYGTEHLMTDAMSKLIIENDILPAFKQGDFYSGIDKGTTAIIQVMKGEYKEERKNLKKGNNESSGGGIFFFIIVFIIIIIILAKRGGGGGNNRGGFGSTLTDILILSSLGSGGSSRGGFGGFGGGSGGGGGGFGGGFGGGGFGGGGASGGW